MGDVIAVQAPVTGVGHDDDSGVHGVGPAAVLVHTGVHIDELVGGGQGEDLPD